MLLRTRKNTRLDGTLPGLFQIFTVRQISQFMYVIVMISIGLAMQVLYYFSC